MMTTAAPAADPQRTDASGLAAPADANEVVSELTVPRLTSPTSSGNAVGEIPEDVSFREALRAARMARAPGGPAARMARMAAHVDEEIEWFRSRQQPGQ